MKSGASEENQDASLAGAFRYRGSRVVPEHFSGEELFPRDPALKPRVFRLLFCALPVVFLIWGGPLWGVSESNWDGFWASAPPWSLAGSVNGISATNGFAARGNVVSVTGSDGAIRQLAWDALGRLILVTTLGVSESHAYYNGLNRRILTEFTPSNGVIQTLDSAFDP